jgi:RNA polymerase sigma-70 factor (ECF subfamily)
MCMKNIQPTECMLIESAQRGDLDAFNDLALKYQDMMFRIALRTLNDESAAADAAQNAMIQAFRNIKSFRGGSFRSWLARVTVNASYDEMRRWRRQASVSFDQVNQDGEEIESLPWMIDLSAGPEERFDSVELRDALQHCVKTLTPEYRLVVVLVDVEGMSYEEVARVADIPIGTVKSRLARARGQLRKSLQSYHNLLPQAYRVGVHAFAGA